MQEEAVGAGLHAVGVMVEVIAAGTNGSAEGDDTAVVVGVGVKLNELVFAEEKFPQGAATDVIAVACRLPRKSFPLAALKRGREDFGRLRLT